jgi:hypothetical protein
MDLETFQKKIAGQSPGPHQRPPVSHGAHLPPEFEATPAGAQGRTSNQPVTVTGTARDAFLGAVVLRDNGTPVYIDGLQEWDPKDLGRRVEATGTLVLRHLAPAPTVDPNGAVSHGMAGSASVLEDATWKFV